MGIKKNRQLTEFHLIHLNNVSIIRNGVFLNPKFYKKWNQNKYERIS